MAVGVGDPAVDRGRELECDIGTRMVALGVEEDGVLGRGLIGEEAELHVDSRRAEPRGAAGGHRIGIRDRRHHSPHPGGEQRLRTWRLLAVVIARLEGADHAWLRGRARRPRPAPWARRAARRTRRATPRPRSRRRPGPRRRRAGWAARGPSPATRARARGVIASCSVTVPRMLPAPSGTGEPHRRAASADLAHRPGGDAGRARPPPGRRPRRPPAARR